MSARDPRIPHANSPDWSRVALDWLDLLLILGVGYGSTLLLRITGLTLRPTVVGLVLASIVLATLGLRRQIFPARQGMVKAKFSWLGLLSTALLVGGFIAAGLGGLLLFTMSRETQTPVEASEVEAQVQQWSRTQPLLELAAALGNAQEVEVSEHDVPTDAAGGLAELEAQIEAQLAAPPDPNSVRLYREEVARELEERNRVRFEEQKDQGERTVTWLAVFGFGALLLGGVLDSKRARVTPGAEPTPH